MTALKEAPRLTCEDHKDVMRDLVANIRDPELDAEALGNWLRCYGRYVEQAEAAAKAEKAELVEALRRIANRATPHSDGLAITMSGWARDALAKHGGAS